MKKKIIIALILLIIAGCIGTGIAFINYKNKNTDIASNNLNTGYRFSFADFNNRKVDLNKKPERIVSLSPSVTEILCDLGQSNNIIAVSQETKYPQNIVNKTKVGSFGNVDIDKIKSLRPDIVFISKYQYQNSINELIGQGIPVAFLEADSFNGIFDGIDIIGNMFMIKNDSDKLSADIKKQVEEVTNRITTDTRPNILYIQSVEPLFVGGSKTLINDIIWLSGGSNVAVDITGYGEMDINQLSQRTVDMIIMPGSIAKDYNINYFQTHSTFKDLNAVKNNKILMVADEDIYQNATPRITKAIEEIASFINK